MPNFDDFKLAIEAMTGGKNTVLFDDMEMPSVMVPFPKMKIAEIMSGGSQNIHPAFSVGGVEKDVLYISKFQNIVLNDRAYSLPMRDPKVYVTFDQALSFCRNKGKGWSLNPYSLWSAIALWCRKNGNVCQEETISGVKITHTSMKKVFPVHGKARKRNHIQANQYVALPDPTSHMVSQLDARWHC